MSSMRSKFVLLILVLAFMLLVFLSRSELPATSDELLPKRPMPEAMQAPSDVVVLDEPAEPVASGGSGRGLRSEGVDPERVGIEIRVVDVNERSLGQAKVFAMTRESGPVLLGITTESEGLTVTEDQLDCGWLAARHAGHAQGLITLPEVLPKTLTIQLGEGATITGVVTHSDGSAISSGVAVVALPVNRIPKISSLAELARVLPDLFVAYTDEFGSFTINGLEAQRDYELVAGEAGWLSSERTVAKPGGSDVELEVMPVYGACVSLVDADGGPLEVSPTLRRHDGFVSRHLDPTADTPNQRGLNLALAGIDPAEVKQGPRQHVLLFTSRQDRASLLSMSVRLNPPGYQSLETAIPLPRCYGKLEVQEIALKKLGSGWTNLSVQVRGLPALPIGRSGAMEPGMTLELVDPQGQLAVLGLDLSEGQGASTHHIPAGEYRYRVKISGLRGQTSALLDGEALSLGGPEDSLVLDWPEGVGALELEFSDKEGVPASGQSILYYRPLGGARHFFVRSFYTAPYVIEAFPAGDWQMYGVTGLSSPPGKDAALTLVTVSSGELARASLQSN